MEREAAVPTSQGLMRECMCRGDRPFPCRKPSRRYLWTVAFALCNFLGFYRETGDDKYLRLALALVDQVHGILGRHRQDDPRSDRISGLDDCEERSIRPPADSGSERA